MIPISQALIALSVLIVATLMSCIITCYNLKMYNVETTVGDYKAFAFNKLHAKLRAYRWYKKSRNTNYEKFKSKIIKISEIK